MSSQIKNYIATDQNGKTVIVSGYTEVMQGRRQKKLWALEMLLSLKPCDFGYIDNIARSKYGTV